VILELAAVLWVYWSGICLQPEYRLDALFNGTLLQLEMRADATMLGQRHGRIAELGCAVYVLRWRAVSVAVAERAVPVQVYETDGLLCHVPSS
jgi:hypothetical protein